MTGDDGSFTVPDLLPGVYTVTAEQQLRSGTANVTVTAGAAAQVTVEMAIR